MIASRLMQDLQESLGVSPEVAAGIVGNLAHESGGFEQLQELQPTVPGARGGYGYAQWTGPRREQFEGFASERGLEPSSYEANRDFLLHELTNTPEKKVLASLNAAKTPGEAAEIFSNEFLRPGIPHMDKRKAMATEIYGSQGQDTIAQTYARQIKLPDGRIIGLTGNETPEQLTALKEKLRTKYQTKQPKKASKKEPSYPVGLSDMVFEGLTLGAGPKLANMAADLITGGDMKEGFSRYQEGVKEYENENPLKATLGRLGGGFVGAGKLAATKPVQALGNLAGRGGTLGKIGAGALAGETSQRVYEAGTAGIGEEGAILGRKGISLGGILGGAVPGLGSAFNQLKKTLTPAIKDSAQKTIQLAKKYDIPLGVDDITDSNFYKYLISEGQNLPFSGGGSKAEKQLSKFTRAIAKTVGLDDVDTLTPENLDKAFDTVGKQFDDLTKGKTFTVGDEALDSLSQIEEGVSGGAYGQDGIRLFKQYTDDLFAALDDNALSGDRLAKLRNKFARISRKGTNVDAKTLAKDMENLLVDMIGDGAPAKLQQAKQQYKNLIVIEPLAAKAQVDGFISPALLTNRVNQVYGRAFRRGKAGDIGELAQLGQAIKQSTPQSGTAPRQMVQEVLQSGTALGSGFINPMLPLIYFGGRGAQFAGNRALQNRNVNSRVLGSLAHKRLPAPMTGQRAIQGGASAGTALGILQQ